MTELKLRTGGATHRGAHRENNEDSMVVAGSLCVVADGMGGHEAGEVASRLCVRQLAYSPFFTMPGGRSEEEQQAYAELMRGFSGIITHRAVSFALVLSCKPTGKYVLS